MVMQIHKTSVKARAEEHGKQKQTNGTETENKKAGRRKTRGVGANKNENNSNLLGACRDVFRGGVRNVLGKNDACALWSGKVCNTVQVAQALSHVEWISQGLETSKPRNMKASNAEALLYHHTIAYGTQHCSV